jgi:hypothetical protein
MDESSGTVRADIEATRARMSTTIAQIEKKVDVVQKVRDNPWPALALAFGAGLALSASGADKRATGVGADVAGKTASKLGSALDDVLATTVAGLAAAFQGRIDEALSGVIASIGGSSSGRSGSSVANEVPARAD